MYRSRDSEEADTENLSTLRQEGTGNELGHGGTCRSMASENLLLGWSEKVNSFLSGGGSNNEDWQGGKGGKPRDGEGEILLQFRASIGRGRWANELFHLRSSVEIIMQEGGITGGKRKRNIERCENTVKRPSGTRENESGVLSGPFLCGKYERPGGNGKKGGGDRP